MIQYWFNDFVVTLDTDVHKEVYVFSFTQHYFISISQAVGRQYRKKCAKEQYSALEFENDEISLDIINSSGWEILALSENH